MNNTDRRQFLKKSAVAAGAAAIAVPAIAKEGKSPNDQVRVGLLGLGGRMNSHIAALKQMKDENVAITAICDCDQPKLDRAQNAGPLKDLKLTAYDDMKKMFDDKSIDAVSISLGDRWHALSTIWACQAGKDVYVEKPGTHNLFEGRQMVAAARKYNRMVQHGTQNRSSPNIREGIQKMKEGVIGDLYMGRGLDYKIRGNLGTITPSEVPKGLDWDKWLGPKPMRPYSQFWHRRWYWNLELASGCFANQAIHELDVLRWGLDIKEHPVLVSAIGGKYVHEDDRTSPTHMAITFKFKDDKPMLTYEHRSWFTNSEAGFRDQYPFVQPGYPVGTIFFGSKGYEIFPDYSSYRTFLGQKCEPGPFKFDPSHTMADLPHFQNWVKAIRERDHKILCADIEEGHRTMALCLLARTSYQVGRPIEINPETEQIIGDDEANRLLNEPEYRAPYLVPKEV